MFGIGIPEMSSFVFLIIALFLGILSLLMPYFIYRIGINISEMRTTLEAMHNIIENHFGEK